MIVRGSHYNPLTDKQSNRLKDFCLKNSRYIILARRHEEGLASKAIEDAIAKRLEELNTTAINQIKYAESEPEGKLKKETLMGRKTLIKNIKERLVQDKTTVEQYAIYHSNIKDTLLEDLASHGLAKREISIGSLVTFPGLWDLCYFEKTWEIRGALSGHIYTAPITIGGYTFEDLAFADDHENPWAMTCSHENFYTIHLNDERYAEFKKLGIE